MSQESDALMRAVQVYVHGRVPPDFEETATELVARLVALVMTTPQFLNNLTVVQELQRENWNLRQALIQYQQAEMARVRKAQARRATAARKTPAKKAVAKKTPAPRKAPPKKASPNAAFKRGASGR